MVNENLSISVADAPGAMVEFDPSVPVLRVVVGCTGVAGLPVGVAPVADQFPLESRANIL